jgi:tagatose 6-phosphate kinase
MILSVGLTPAWQQILTFDAFRPGEVNRATSAAWCASGKVFNAGIGVAQLGGDSHMLAPIGGPNRRIIEDELNSLGVRFHPIPTETATRICTTVLDRNAHAETELVEEGRPILDDELAMFLERYEELAPKADVIVLIGSLPPNVSHSLYRQLIKPAHCPVVCDFRGEGLLNALDAHPFLVKPNREELQHTFQRPLTSESLCFDAMRQLNERGAEWAVVTDGPHPILISSLHACYRIAPPKIVDEEIVNPIGCGDAMTATIAWASDPKVGLPWKNEKGVLDVLDRIRLGVAASCVKLQDLLPCRLHLDQVKEISKTLVVERVD